MANANSSTRSLAPAAGYIRMSSGKQERSPAQQRGEIDKLAVAERCKIVLWFEDEAITGDSGPNERPGFRSLLEAAERGEFQVLLLENADRLGRFDSIAGAEFYNRLRNAGIRIVTAAEGEIDLTTFEGRVVHTVRQEGRHAFLRDLSRKVVRGQLANAKAGNSNGGQTPYAFVRALVNAEGKTVRILQPGETVRLPGHRVRQVPGDDKHKLDAVRYMFRRFANADLSYTAIAKELTGKGYPSSNGGPWLPSAVNSILRNPAYAGDQRWGTRSTARYHTLQGDSIVPANGNGKPADDAIPVASAYKPVVDPAVFAKVQRKVAKRLRTRTRSTHVFPLSGLLYCSHCGAPLDGHVLKRPNRHGKAAYVYTEYLCRTYGRFGRGLHGREGCGRHSVRAEIFLDSIVKLLQQAFLGPGREELIAAVSRQLAGGGQDTKGERRRLQDRLTTLDKSVAGLVAAIRIADDVPELARELANVKAERDAVKAELQRLGVREAAGDPQREAVRLADLLWEVRDQLSQAPPELLRELLGSLVDKIVCQWETTTRNGKPRAKLTGGEVHLRRSELTEAFYLSQAHAVA